MSDPVTDFASFDNASRQARGIAGPRRGGMLVTTLLVCGVALFAGGCGWVPLWPGGDGTVDLRRGKASPGQIAAALELARIEMQANPQEPYWPFRMGELYVAADSINLAATHLHSALGIDPGYAPAAALLSKLYYDAGLFEDGIDLLDGFLGANANAPDELRVALALHLEALGELDRAHEVLDGCSGDVSAAQTFVTLRGDEIQPVLDTAKLALEANPKSAANHNNYGIALLHAGRPVEARKAFLKALDIDDKHPGALYNMAIVEAFYFFDEKAGHEWFEKYRKYASDDPDDLATRFAARVSTLSEPDARK